MQISLLGYIVVSPWRWLIAVLVPILCTLWGLKRKAIDMSGAILGKFRDRIIYTS